MRKMQLLKGVAAAAILALAVSGCAKDTRLTEVADDPTGGLQISEGDYFYVYQESGSRQNHYAPSGWMGDHGDMRINESYSDNPRVGNSCIEIRYSARGSQGAGWGGIYWQNPANNWGDVRGGYNLTGAESVTFWARGAEGGEYITEFKIGGIDGVYSDSGSASIGPITLTDEWQKYTIDLSGVDLSYISGGFCWVTSAQFNPDGIVFYLDEIRYNLR